MGSPAFPLSLRSPLHRYATRYCGGWRRDGDAQGDGSLTAPPRSPRVEKGKRHSHSASRLSTVLDESYSQGRGRGFDSPTLHQEMKKPGETRAFYISRAVEHWIMEQ